MSTTITLPVGALPGGGGGSGIQSINADTTSAQLIVGTSPIAASTSTGTTTVSIASTAVVPSQTGNNGKFLTTNGTASSWATVSATPGSPTTSVQFNNSGSFAGDANLVWDNTNKFLGIGAAAQDPLGIRAGTDNNFAVSGPISMSGNGVTIHSYNDAKNANEGLEIRATKTIFDVGPIGIGVDPPTAYLEVRGSNGSAGGAALKIGSGTLLATPESGAFEYDGTHVYFDIGSTRYQIDQQGTTAAAAAPATSIQFNTGGFLDGTANLTWDGNKVLITSSASGSSSGQEVLALHAFCDNTPAGSGPLINFYGDSGFFSGGIIGSIGVVDSPTHVNATDLVFSNYIQGFGLSESFRIIGSGGWDIGQGGLGTFGQVLLSADTAHPNWTSLGADTQIIFNSSGVPTGSGNLTWDGSTVLIHGSDTPATHGQTCLIVEASLGSAGDASAGGPKICFENNGGTSTTCGHIRAVSLAAFQGSMVIGAGYGNPDSMTDVLFVNGDSTVKCIGNLDAASYSAGGTSGFTGSGIFTTFTIVGGIITAAS